MAEKNVKDEVVVVKTTERFRFIFTTLKLTVFGGFAIIILYWLYTFFGGYFFLQFFIALIICFGAFNKLYEAPGELVLECRIGSEKDEKNKGDVLGLDKVPNEILKDYTPIGSNIRKFSFKTGKTVSIVEKIDHMKKEIIYPWFSELSDFEFFIRKETYINLKKRFKNILDDILKTKETRELYRQLETIKLLDYLESEKDIEKIKKELSGIEK